MIESFTQVGLSAMAIGFGISNELQ